jgi:hypothetical protein
VVTVASAVGIAPVRHSLLRSAGWTLVAEDAPEKADLIVVSSDLLDAGYAEAADLVKAGYAGRVAIFTRPVTRIQKELERRGVEPIDLKSVSIRILGGLGVTNVELLPPVVGTVDEGQVLRQWCVAHSIHSIIFVSVADHSRRTRRVLKRALTPSGITVRVRYARYSDFDPDAWWLTRSGQRVLIVESQKLLLDFFRHPF